MLRAERFLEATEPRRLAALSAQAVAEYLAEAGRDRSLAARQFLQIVAAIRILGLAAGAPWVDPVDWGARRSTSGGADGRAIAGQRA